jgi:CheY-like chemotaxis protein
MPPIGKRTLIVEDEAIVAMLVEDMLTDIGCKVLATAPTIPVALDLVAKLAMELAVVDVNLRGQTSYPVADALRARGIPFLFVTGYGAEALDDGYRHHRTLQKPFGEHELAQAIAAVLGPAPKIG